MEICVNYCDYCDVWYRLFRNVITKLICVDYSNLSSKVIIVNKLIHYYKFLLIINDVSYK